MDMLNTPGELFQRMCISLRIPWVVEEQVALIQSKYQAIAPYLNERSRRLWAASEARALGHGGQKRVHEATGLSCATISKGERELAAVEAGQVKPERIRKAGGGRKSKLELDKTLQQDLADIPIRG